MFFFLPDLYGAGARFLLQETNVYEIAQLAAIDLVANQDRG